VTGRSRSWWFDTDDRPVVSWSTQQAHHAEDAIDAVERRQLVIGMLRAMSPKERAAFLKRLDGETLTATERKALSRARQRARAYVTKRLSEA